MLHTSMAIATLGGLIATGVAALPAQADRIATAGHRGGVNMASTAHIPAALAAITGARHRHGTLTGVVVGVDGRPVTGACVTATSAAGDAMAMTRADGRYVLTGSAAGSIRAPLHRMRFRAAIIRAGRVEPWISSSASSNSRCA